jgi:hypothetical protein
MRLRGAHSLDVLEKRKESLIRAWMAKITLMSEPYCSDCRRIPCGDIMHEGALNESLYVP